VFAFLHCLPIFLPAKYADGNGKGKERFWGLPLLGFGAFWSVMATAYVVRFMPFFFSFFQKNSSSREYALTLYFQPLMLQLTATNQYGFKPGDNGFLCVLFCPFVFFNLQPNLFLKLSFINKFTLIPTADI
jgi:hypothetical protein